MRSNCWHEGCSHLPCGLQADAVWIDSLEAKFYNALIGCQSNPIQMDMHVKVAHHRKTMDKCKCHSSH